MVGTSNLAVRQEELLRAKLKDVEHQLVGSRKRGGENAGVMGEKNG